MLLAERTPELQSFLHPPQRPFAAAGDAEVNVGAGDLEREAILHGQSEGSLELDDALRRAAHRCECAEAAAGADLGLAVFETLCELERPPRPTFHVLDALGHEHQGGTRSVRHRELVTRGKSFEQLDRLLGGLDRLGLAGHVEEDEGARPKAALPPPSACRPRGSTRSPHRSPRALPRLGRRGSTRRIGGAAAPHDPRVEGRRRSAALSRTVPPPPYARRATLPARPLESRTGARLRSRQPLPHGAQGGPGPQLPGTRRAQRAPPDGEPARGPAGPPPRSRAARARVGKRLRPAPADEHPGGQAFVQRTEHVGGDRLEQAELGARRNDGDDLEQRTGRRASSREARASTASRTVDGISSTPAASASVTKNGLPPVIA